MAPPMILDAFPGRSSWVGEKEKCNDQENTRETDPDHNRNKKFLAHKTNLGAYPRKKSVKLFLVFLYTDRPFSIP